ncbi:MAG: ATP-binding protein [Acidobacteriota bacterium]|nr:ATP-binding protein [Blastocatellia bacterium]MDW8238789.1 ATP-binding protein [Acidobacteriota bacterium]
MSWLVGLTLCVLFGAVLIGGWLVHHRVRLPLARLRHTLRTLGVPCDDSAEATLRTATEQLKDLARHAQQAEKDLALLSSLILRTDDGIIVVDRHLRIVLANRAAAALWGRAETGLEGSRLADLVRDKQVYDGFCNAIEQQQPFQGRFERAEGHDRQVFELHITPLDNQHAAGVFLNITRVEQLERVRQEFLTNVSHELRTPLTSIMAYVETLLDGALDDPEHRVEFLRVIERHARRLHSLIDDISDLSAIESGEIRLEMTEVNLRSIVAEVVQTLQPRAQRNDVHLVNEVPFELVVKADHKRFEQILINLIDNAIKFNRPGGSVYIHAQRCDDQIIISVKDTGIGIPAADLPRIFERFYRVDKARSVEAGGTGLGLAIVKHLVKVQGGRINIESKPDEGTCVSLTWPAANVAEAEMSGVA